MTLIEAAKISALSSGKIDKYEYLTGEEILPFNQKQIIEKANFIYSPLRKAFEKQIKNNWTSRRKTNKSNSNQGQINTIKKYAYDDEDSPLISKEKVIFNTLADERLEEITKLDKKVNPDDLIYRQRQNVDAKFDKFDNAFNILDKIRKGKIKLADAKNDQIKL